MRKAKKVLQDPKGLKAVLVTMVRMDTRETTATLVNLAPPESRESLDPLASMVSLEPEARLVLLVLEPLGKQVPREKLVNLVSKVFEEPREGQVVMGLLDPLGLMESQDYQGKMVLLDHLVLLVPLERKVSKEKLVTTSNLN